MILYLEIDVSNKLQVLNLSRTNISDINILEKVNFKELKELNLRGNKISDIKVLEKVDFKELKKLDLSSNNINEKDNSLILSKLKSKIKDFSY